MFLLLCVGASCAFGWAVSLDASLHWRSRVSLDDCPVALPLDSFSGLAVEQRRSLCVFLNGEELPSQLDDLDGDSVPDEIAFLLSVRKNRSYTLQLRPVQKPHAYTSEVWAEMFLKGEIGGDFKEHTAEGKTTESSLSGNRRSILLTGLSGSCTTMG